MADFIINDANFHEFIDPTVNGETKKRGLIPRPMHSHPTGFYGPATAFDMPLIPRDQWADRIREMEATQSRLSDIRRSSGPGGGLIPSLDQNGVGYCWIHSGTMGVMLARAVAGLPYVRLSAFAPGCLIKNYKDEGGWGAAGLDFIMKNGVPSVEFWPEKSMKRANDTPAMRENALLHRVTEGWMDMAAAAYDRNLTEDQAMTGLLNRLPTIADENWWGHSVILMDPTITNAAVAKSTDLGSLDLNIPKDASVMAQAFGKRGLNSWTDDWGDRGEFVLQGSKAHLDGGAIIRVTTASLV